jgi:hypothetical protein
MEFFAEFVFLVFREHSANFLKRNQMFRICLAIHGSDESFEFLELRRQSFILFVTLSQIDYQLVDTLLFCLCELVLGVETSLDVSETVSFVTAALT